MSAFARSVCYAASLLPALVAMPAQATYSLLIADASTGLIGSVGVSCVGRQAVSAISGIAPGFGAIHAQAQSNASGRDRGVMMLKAGATADEIISAITAPNFDRSAAARQYGVVTLQGSAAGYTGSSNMAYADDRQARIGSHVSSYQGNILTSAAVLDQLADSLREGKGCDLPETLMLALEAGAQNEEGDSRCTSRGIPADSGFLKVVDRDGQVLISIEVTGRSADGAVVGLREQFDTWRTTRPCTARLDAGAAADAADAAADAAAATVADASGPSTMDARAPAQGTPPRDAAGARSSSDGASAGAQTAEAGRVDARVEDAGVRATQTEDERPDRAPSRDSGCSVAPASAPSWLLALGVLLASRRRRRMDCAQRRHASKPCRPY